MSKVSFDELRYKAFIQVYRAVSPFIKRLPNLSTHYQALIFSQAIGLDIDKCASRLEELANKLTGEASFIQGESGIHEGYGYIKGVNLDTTETFNLQGKLNAEEGYNVIFSYSGIQNPFGEEDGRSRRLITLFQEGDFLINVNLYDFCGIGMIDYVSLEYRDGSGNIISAVQLETLPTVGLPVPIPANNLMLYPTADNPLDKDSIRNNMFTDALRFTLSHHDLAEFQKIHSRIRAESEKYIGEKYTVAEQL